MFDNESSIDEVVFLTGVTSAARVIEGMQGDIIAVMKLVINLYFHHLLTAESNRVAY